MHLDLLSIKENSERIYYYLLSIPQFKEKSKRIYTCCCFSHSANWLPTRNILLYSGQSRSWSAEQGEKKPR